MTLMNTDHTFALVLISAEYQQIVMLTEHEDSSQESKLEFQGTDNKGKEDIAEWEVILPEGSQQGQCN